MKYRTRILLIISSILVTFCMSGCKMVREVDVGDMEISGDTDSTPNTENPQPIVVKDGDVFDEESVFSYFYGEDRESLLEGGYLNETWYEETLIESQCIKDEIELLYSYNFALDIAESRCQFRLCDLRESPDGKSYREKIKTQATSVAPWYHWVYQSMKNFPEVELESCTREEAISACAPLAKACGYEDAQVRLYAMVDGSNKNRDAYILIYQSVLNGLVLDIFRSYDMMCIYVPEYGRVVYAEAYQPLVLEKVLDEKELITKEEAVAQAILEMRIESLEDITIMDASIVYSPENRKVGFYAKEKTINPCWRIDYVLSDEILKQPFYEEHIGGTIMIDAVEGRISEFYG